MSDDRADTSQWLIAYDGDGQPCLWDSTDPHRPRLLVQQDAVPLALWDYLASQFPCAPDRVVEPGLWGVVEAAREATDVRHAWVKGAAGEWFDNRGRTVSWADLIDPVLVRSGIEPEAALPPDLVDNHRGVWVWNGNPERAHEPDGYDLWLVPQGTWVLPTGLIGGRLGKEAQHHRSVTAVPHGTGIADALARKRGLREAQSHVCMTTPVCDGWPFTADAAYRTIAAVAWPGERRESRDGWAVTMRSRPDLFEWEAASASERLAAAIAHGRDALIQDADRTATDTGEA